MPLFKTLLLLFFISLFFNVYSQTQDDFNNKMTAVYMAGSEKKKAMELAMELYNMTEKSKELQTYANYYMLESIFTNQAPDEKIASACKEKAQQLLQQLTGTSSANTNVPQDVSSKWYNEVYPDLFKTIHKDNADKAVSFLEKNPSLQNFSNYTYIGYAYERNGDFYNAKKYYEYALTFQADPKTEFLPLNYYTNFLCRSGDYLKAEEYIQKLDRLSVEAIDIFKTSYRTCALTSKTVYYLTIGDYQSFVQSADEQYNYFENLPSFKSDKHNCNAFAEGRLTLEAYANEMLKEYDLAKKQWFKRDSSNYVWVNCVNKIVPDSNRTYPLSMLPVFLCKRGQKSLLEKDPAYYIKEAEVHFNSYKDYSDISVNYMKANHFGFLGSSQYHQLFVPILKQIKETKNFRESTIPFAHYAYFNMRDRRLEKSYEYYKQLFELNVVWINDVIFSLGERAFVTYYNAKLREGYDNFHSFVKLASKEKPGLLPSLASQAYNNLLFTKALSLKGIQKRKKTFLNNNDPAVKNLYDQWIDKKQELIRQYQRASDISQDSLKKMSEQQLKVLQEEVSHLENELTLKAKDFKKFLKLETPDWKAVQARLKEGEAAVEMVRFGWRDQVYYSDTSYYAAYIITKDSQFPDVVYLPDFAQDLDYKYYSRYKNNIKFKLEDKESYNHYWKPVMEKLKGIKRIYFSPDGIYHIVSLNTLMNPETGKFIIEELEIQYTTSTSDLLSQASSSEILRAVLFGRPAYNMENFNSGNLLAEDHSGGFVRGFQGDNISDLPGTEEEVLTIKKQMEASGISAKCYLREEAREDVLYKVKNPDILHIATHGYWSDAGPKATDGYRLFNAMINSGLLLSGVVNYYRSEITSDTYDGILTAYEAQNLDLENTSLVILSACETSLGHFDAGEGVYGLQRAFRAAGAKSVMTSLWKVDDNATKDFMIYFYQNFIKTKDKYSSFVLAQRALMKKYPQPYYWGAFILSGI